MKKLSICVLLAITLLYSHNRIGAAQEKVVELKAHRLQISGKDWALEISVPPDFISEKQFETEDSFLLRNTKTDFSIRANLEKASTEGDSIAVREYYEKIGYKSPIKTKDIKRYEIGEAAIREFTIKDSRFQVLGGGTLVVKNVIYYLAHDGYWAVVHMIKLRYDRSDKKLFEEILKNIKIVRLTGEANPTGRDT